MNLYADTAAFVLRVDQTMYSVFAYLAIFRLEELGFRRFREFAASQDPAKMFNFVNYLFDKVRGKTQLHQFLHHLAKIIY